jgi:hypothetical protein
MASNEILRSWGFPWRRSRWHLITPVILLLLVLSTCLPARAAVAGGVGGPAISNAKGRWKSTNREPDAVLFMKAQKRGNAAQMAKYNTLPAHRLPRPSQTAMNHNRNRGRSSRASWEGRNGTNETKPVVEPSPGVIVLGANHKTGTFFFKRAAQILKKYVDHVFLCSHWDGALVGGTDTSCASTIRKFTSPKPGSLQERSDVRVLHSARDPFDMAVSALLYHRTCDEIWATSKLPKTWHNGAREVYAARESSTAGSKSLAHIRGNFTASTKVIFDSLGDETKKGAVGTAAARLEGNIPMPALPVMYGNETWISMVSRLSDAEGLLVEMTRMIFRDFKGMMLGARASRNAPKRTSQCTACLNLFMYRSNHDYGQAWEKNYFPCIPPSMVGGEARADMRVDLEDKYKSKPDAKGEHRTDHSNYRANLIALAEAIDFVAFGGLFKLSQHTLNKYHSCNNLWCRTAACSNVSEPMRWELLPVAQRQQHPEVFDINQFPFLEVLHASQQGKRTEYQKKSSVQKPHATKKARGSAPSDRVKTETTFSFVALLRNAAGWIVWLLVVCAVLNCLLRVLGASATSSGDQDSRRSRKKSTKSRKEKETEAETAAAAVSTADSDEPE